MNRGFYYFAGLILIIMGLIGVISALGLLFIRYLVLAMGLVLLYVGFIKNRRNNKSS